MKIIRKRFDIPVAASGDKVKKDFELEKTIKRISGLLVTSDRDDMLFYRGSQKIEVNGREVFPEDYESKLLMSGISLQPNKRYFEANIEAGNGIVSVTYQDTDHPAAAFTPYRISLYIQAQE